MGKHYMSQAKKNRSIVRLMEFKQSYLEDLWNCEIEINTQVKKIIWKASTILNLTLKKKIAIVETRQFYSPSFVALPIGEKLSKFQNMWEPDQDSSTFFACMYEHLKRNSSQCSGLCHRLSSPNCGALVYFLSTNKWPDG
jgi:hypothetical protein